MKQGPLNIVMLTTVRLHQSKGGTEKVMIDTANAMVERGHNVTIIFRDKNGSVPSFQLSEKVRLVNCIAAKTPIWYTGAVCDLRSVSFSKEEKNRKKALLNLKTVACRYRQAIESYPADIYLTYDPKLSAMLVREFNVKQPVISTLQFDPSHIIKRYYFQAIKSLIAQAGPIQVLTPEFEKTIHSAIPEAKCVSIPNVVFPVENQALLDNPVIVNVGRVMPLKNQELIIRAMAILRHKFPDWTFKIFGECDVDAECSTALKNLVKSEKLDDVVSFSGVSNNIERELLSSSIFAFPSTSEGFSLALTEAMAAGLPCVGLKDCAGVAYLIKDGVNGLLCENTPESLAGSLERLISDKQLRQRLGNQARMDMSQYYPSQIWDRWEKFIYSLV